MHSLTKVGRCLVSVIHVDEVITSRDKIWQNTCKYMEHSHCPGPVWTTFLKMKSCRNMMIKPERHLVVTIATPGGSHMGRPDPGVVMARDAVFGHAASTRQWEWRHGR